MARLRQVVVVVVAELGVGGLAPRAPDSLRRLALVLRRLRAAEAGGGPRHVERLAVEPRDGPELLHGLVGVCRESLERGELY